MLFDLRGRGRRRTVRAIYLGLAALMGVGLVGFGIGGGFGGGGLLTAASNNEGANSASFAAQITRYRKLTRQQPKNLAAWEGLTKALLHEAGGEAYVTRSGEATSKGKELFKQASQAWTGYLALNPPKPSSELAQLMVSVYGEQGLNEPAKAVEVLQLVLAARPTSAALWASLAEYAYKAHEAPLGEQASTKAVSLAPAAQRARLKTELAQIKKSPTGGGETYTTTTNGKTYAVKPSGNGSFTGTSVSPAPPASGKTTTAKK
jgi:hypothetical protein